MAKAPQKPPPYIWQNPPQWYLNQLEGDAAVIAKSGLDISRDDSELFNGFTHAYVSAVLSYYWGSTLAKLMGDNREDGTFASYSARGKWGDADLKGKYLYQDGFRDLYNNQVGRNVADSVIDNYGYIERSGLDLLGMIKQGVVQAYRDGKVITDLKNDPRVPQSVPLDSQTGRLLSPTEYFYGPNGPNRQSPGQAPQTAAPQGYYPDGGDATYGANAGAFQLYSPAGAPQALGPSLFASQNGGAVTAYNGAGMPDSEALHPGNGSAGRMISNRGTDGYGRDYFIDFGGNAPRVQLPRVQANEITLGIDGLADQIDISGLRGELQTVYHDLNSPDPSQSAPLWTPQAAGFARSDVNREYISEAIRAHLANPGYMQAMAPNTAAAIQDALNANPQIASGLQANGIMPFVIGVGSANDAVPSYDWTATDGGAVTSN